VNATISKNAKMVVLHIIATWAEVYPR